MPDLPFGPPIPDPPDPFDELVAASWRDALGTLLLFLGFTAALLLTGHLP